MMYHAKEVSEYCESEDIKFIKLAFCDVFGKQKNISVMPSELERAFEDGIAFDGSAVRGFGDITSSDLFLRPDPSTLTILPWRPEQQRVARMYCSIYAPDGGIHACDTRTILGKAVEAAEEKGIRFLFGREHGFTVYDTEKNGAPADDGGYMDLAPLDSCENFRRELCLTFERMGIKTESSHHGSGHGQNRLTFGPADPMKAADDTLTFITAARAVAESCGLTADLADSSFFVNIAVKDGSPDAIGERIESRMKALTPFLVMADGCLLPPRENEAEPPIARLRLRGVSVNPYIVFALLIYAGICDDTEVAGFAERHLPGQIVDMYER